MFGTEQEHRFRIFTIATVKRLYSFGLILKTANGILNLCNGPLGRLCEPLSVEYIACFLEKGRGHGQHHHEKNHH